MQTRPRFICLGAVLAVLLCLAALAVVQPSARAATPAVPNATPTVNITSGGLSFCPAESNPITIQAGTPITFVNQTQNDVTVTYHFIKPNQDQTTSVAAGKTVNIVPNFATEFTYTVTGFNQTCFVDVSEAIPQTPTPGIPGVPPSGGGPVAKSGNGPSQALWGALLATLGLVGLGGTLAVRRRWFR